jgi:ABC-type uncharacterized transport system substrate-binding protein
MKRISFENFIIGLFLAASMALFIWYNVHRKTILVLHSYATDYSWVRDIDVGINRVLKHHTLYSVRWYYMDTKRHPSASYKESAGKAARSVVEKMQPDVIIAVDDNAQQYVTRYFVDDPKIKIVFSGVNNEASDYGFDKANNATGVLERLPLGAIRETLQMADNFKNLQHPIRIAYLADQSESVKGDEKQIKRFDWAPLQLSADKLVKTFPEWQAAVEALNKEADIIMLTGYRGLHRSDTNRALVPPKEVVAWTEAHSKIPIISGNGFFIEDGGMLAIGTSPYQQGEAAADMAVQILMDGKRPNQIPIVSSTQFVVSMNATKMNARHFVLPKVYEAAARIGDKYIP